MKDDNVDTLNIKMSLVLILAFDLISATLQTSFLNLLSGLFAMNTPLTYRKFCCVGTGSVLRKL